VVVCLEQGADLHMAQLMPLPLTVSCFSKSQIGFTFLVLAHLGCPGKKAVKWLCVCVYALSVCHMPQAQVWCIYGYDCYRTLIGNPVPEVKTQWSAWPYAWPYGHWTCPKQVGHILLPVWQCLVADRYVFASPS